MQLWLFVIHLLLLVMQLCPSVRHSIMARSHSIIQYRLTACARARARKSTAEY